MKIGRLEIRIIPWDNGLQLVARDYEKFVKDAKLSPSLHDRLDSLCYAFRCVGRRESEPEPHDFYSPALKLIRKEARRMKK